jgi:hypothetical protein
MMPWRKGRPFIAANTPLAGALSHVSKTHTGRTLVPGCDRSSGAYSAVEALIPISGRIIMASRIHCVPRARRAGIVVNKARSTVFTVSAFWKTCATSGSSKTATDPAPTRSAKRFGFALL